LSGRTFEATGRAGSAGVAVINDDDGQGFYPTGRAVGKTLWLGPPEEVNASLLPAGFRLPRLTIVGVVADARFAGLDVVPQPEVYALYAQSTETPPTLYLALRSLRDPAGVIGDLRPRLRALDAAMPLAEVATVQQLLRESGAQHRFGATLVSAFAVLAFGLAIVGVYCVVAHFVTQRTRELGIRMALGAAEHRVLRFAVWGGVATALAGTFVGLAASLALGSIMRQFVFGITPTDLVTFVTVPTVLLVAVVSRPPSQRYARRASRPPLLHRPLRVRFALVFRDGLAMTGTVPVRGVCPQSLTILGSPLRRMPPSAAVRAQHRPAQPPR
jgi:hypothetical protein